MARELAVDCCIAGGGPAGVMAGYLFARAGCRVLVLEKHDDFLRDFRGDTIHPSTLEILNELGLLESFLERPHQKLARLEGAFAGERFELTDFSSLKASCKFIAFMPQWHFLDFLVEAAQRLPTFAIQMSADVTRLIREENRIVGVRADTPEGPLSVRARLVIGADGRDSTVRGCAGLRVENVGAPIDVLWFRLPRDPESTDAPLFNAGQGHAVVSINRGEYYQCAFVIPKGEAAAVKERGLPAFRRAVATTVPFVAKSVDAIDSFEDVKLLSVSVDRLTRWSLPGLLMIGDSAHAMSPIGGVGINLAIQDSVAAANLLAGPLANGTLEDAALDRVRRRRLWPVRLTQFVQVQAQNRLLAPIIFRRRKASGVPLPFRLVSRTPWLKRRIATFVGLGFRPEHVRSPNRF